MNHRSTLTALAAVAGAVVIAATQALAAVPAPSAHAHASAKVPGSRVSHVMAKPQAARNPSPPVRKPTPPAHATHAGRTLLLSDAVIGSAQLANARGGTDTHQNQNTATGAVASNVASHLTTGSNSISSSAFSNSSGIPIVIQNTGNNVLIQNSTILNLQLTNPQ